MSTKLYSRDILEAAVGLSAFPLDPALPLAGESRSRSCGSTLSLRLSTDEMGRVTGVGCRAHACAVGQAAASVFLAAAKGKNRSDIASARAELAAWLAGEAGAPVWPGIDLLTPARAYPARHGAILLAWDAALAALASPRTLG